MRYRFVIAIVLLFGFTYLVLKPKRNPEPHYTAKEQSPLAIANKVIPDLIGAKKDKSQLHSSPEEIARIREAKQFRNYLQTSYVRLPTIESIRISKDGDLHRVPPEVLESSEIFGNITDKLKANISLTRDALRFYNACAANEQLMTSIRAVCARNLIDWAKIANIDISQVQIPEKILQIANVIPGKN